MPDEFIKTDISNGSSPTLSSTMIEVQVAQPGSHSSGNLWIKPQKNTVLVSHGRPPWYDEDGVRICDAFVIGIAGGSASGKTHVAEQIVKSLGSIPTVIILSQDSFYKCHTPEELELAHANKLDFDHPDSLDMPMFASCLADLKACKQSNIPVYSFSQHQRLEETKYLYGATVIIAEGIMALHDPALRALYDLKIFVQCDSDLMLARRIKRDVQHRGRTVDGVLDQYLRFVKPSYDNFVQPTSSHADIIVPGHNNKVAIDLICTHIRRQLQERTHLFRSKIAIPHLYLPSRSGSPQPECKLEDLNLTVYPQTSQMQGIYTILRSKDSSRQDFIFFVDRLSTLLVEHALQHLPYTAHCATTPVSSVFDGLRMDAKFICGVTILRSGGALERGFRRVINNVPVGSLLIQSDAQTGEPLLLHVQLPTYVRFRHMAEEAYVFLMDAQIGTAAAAFMSIRILLDHGVKQDHIIFVTFLVARGGGVSVLRRAFPQVKIVCGAVDDVMKEGWLEGYRGEGNVEGFPRKVWVMEPGMGQIERCTIRPKDPSDWELPTHLIYYSLSDMPVIELINFTASEKFIHDRKAGNDLFNLVSSSEGCLGIYHGIQHEDKKTIIVLAVWETYEHHQKLIDAPHYSKVKELLAPLSAGNFQMQHFTVSADPTTTFAAPITELAYLKPKEGKIKEGLEILPEAADVVGASKGAYPPPAWGEIRENPHEYYIAVGWETVEAHGQAVGEGKLKSVVEKLITAFDLTVVHVALIKHV